MFAQAFLATLIATAIAAPAPALDRRASGDSFTVIALHSTSAVHLQSVNANDNAFYVGRDTTTFCPATVDCPPGTVTALTAFDNGYVIMDAEVPGGQTVYIDQFGVLRFTVAHTGGDTPPGSVLGGWTYTPGTDGGVGSLTHGSDEILACPAGNEGYEIFVDIGPISIPENCISINLGTYPFEGVAAWQYE